MSGTSVACFPLEFRELSENCLDLKLNLLQADSVLQVDSRRRRAPHSRVPTLESGHRGFL